MKVVGIIATSVVGIAVVIAVVVAIMSIPDMRRYLKIRSM